MFLHSLLVFSLFVLHVYCGQKSCCSRLDKSKERLDEAISSLKKTRDLLGGKVQGDVISTSVGFHARLSKHTTLGQWQIVVFDNVITNRGDAYNRHTGHFTAPYDGMYFFASTFLKKYGTGNLHLAMFKNKLIVSRGHATGATSGSEAGSMNAVLVLDKGDVVTIKGFYNGETIHGEWSFFSGYLINKNA